MTELPTGTVTFLFTDIEGSTRLLRELGDDYASALGLYRLTLRDAFGRHGGIEVDTQGDAFFVAFPRASDAVAAAQEALGALAGGPLRVRVGIHTGEALLTEGGYYVGLDVHRAARIASAAHGGQILISQATRELVASSLELRDLGDHGLKDLSEPQRLYQLGHEQFPPLRSLNWTNLPAQPTPLVGRERELLDVRGLLRDNRLLTLTGAGGVGKTRLALHAAAELVNDFRDGVLFVSLAALSDSQLVLPAVAQTLGLRESETLEHHLREREMLLLLDNFEHVLDVGPQLAQLLRHAPSLKVLVTSRTPLRISGEQEYPVAPLTEEEAVRLFSTRARAATPSFTSDEAVPEICRRLDNLPLALELAAVRMKVFTPEALLARLEQRFALLTGGPRDLDARQRTLRATLEWSYNLLTEEEQRLFTCLAVFAGGFALEAAEKSAGANPDTLQSLVDQSLLHQVAGRFSMLETIREYAVELLDGAQGEAALRRRHAEYFATRATTLIGLSAPDARGVNLGHAHQWRHGLEADLDNLRSALSFAIETSDAELALQLATTLSHFFWLSDVPEGRRWLEQAIALSDQAPAAALWQAGHLASEAGDWDKAVRSFEQALELKKELGDEEAYAYILVDIAESLSALGEFAEARLRYEEAIEVWTKRSDSEGLSNAMHALGELEREQGNTDEAKVLLERSIEITASVRQAAAARHGLADVALDEGDLRRATGLYRQSLRDCWSVGDERSVAYNIAGLAAVAATRGAVAEAGRLWGAVERIEHARGGQLHPSAITRYRRPFGRLDQSALADATAAGLEIDTAEAVQYALRDEDCHTPRMARGPLS